MTGQTGFLHRFKTEADKGTPIQGLMAFGNTGQLLHWTRAAEDLMPDGTYSRARRLLGYKNATMLFRHVDRYEDALMLAGMEFTPGFAHIGVGVPLSAAQFIKARVR